VLINKIIFKIQLDIYRRQNSALPVVVIQGDKISLLYLPKDTYDMTIGPQCGGAT